MRILFMGTPDIAAASLQALLDAGHTIVGVFTRADKPVGRKQILTAPPVKQLAVRYGIPVYQPATLRDGKAEEIFRSLAPDLVVVVAYGRILPAALLHIAPLGCINLHVSLLPKYRGSAPIQWAVLHGDAETGVTIMHMAHDLDAGDIIDQAATPIDPDETVVSLHDRLAQMGAELLVKVVADIAAGTAARTPQDHGKATLAPMLSRELSPMDFTRPARELHNQVRGLIPWPAAVTELGGSRCKVFSTSVLDAHTDAAPGAILAAGKEGIQVACGSGTVLRIDELQADGGKRMKAADYLRGHPIPVG